MKKVLLLTTLLSAFMLSCGEAGFEVDISKETEVDITITSSDYENGFFSKNEKINLAEDEFSKYLKDIKKYEVNSIGIQVVNYENSFEATLPTSLEFQVQRTDRAPVDIAYLESQELKSIGITDRNGRITKGDKILIYDKDDNANSLIDSSNQGLQEVLTVLENRSEMNVYLFLYMDGQFDGEITLKVFFDVTARTQQN